MKLKIRDSKKDECEVWLEYGGDDVDLMWKDEEGKIQIIASLKPDKRIEIFDDSGFTQEK